MKKVIIKNLAGIQTHGAEMPDPSQWIADCVANNYCGLPEREELDDLGNFTGKILPPEYTIEIIDITYEHELDKVVQKRRSLYPSPEEFMNAFFDGGEEAIEELRQRRLEVKENNPKPKKK